MQSRLHPWNSPYVGNCRPVTAVRNRRGVMNGARVPKLFGHFKR